MVKVRKSSISGLFYPADKDELISLIDGLKKVACNKYKKSTRAVIVPHAGLVYSGQLVYEAISQLDKEVKTLFIIAPSHKSDFSGVVVTSCDWWETPLGRIPVDRFFTKLLVSEFGAKYGDDIMEVEHSIEVELPIIQSVFSEVKIVPILYSNTSVDVLKSLLSRFYPDKENAFLISSDLSHFLSLEDSKFLDLKTASMIESLDISDFRYNQACGATGIVSLVSFASDNDYSLIRINLSSSSIVTGDTSSVVGYGCWFLYEGSKNEFLKFYYKDFILNLCKVSINTHLKTDSLTLDYPQVFDEYGACFVTLTSQGNLRGCIGSVIAHRPLIRDILLNAESAAFRDSRFLPVTTAEVESLKYTVSLLSVPKRILFKSEIDLLNQLVPFRDGLIIKEMNFQAVYLPEVWGYFSNKNEFLSSLKIKAGLSSNYFSETFEAYRFETVVIE